MPSPFPGMDPYLEDPTVWPDAHAGIIAYMREALNESLPDGFMAKIDRRVYVEQSERHVQPDVAVVRKPVAARTREHAHHHRPADRPEHVTIIETEERETFIKVVMLRPEPKIVTVIELLSHANKSPGSTGRELYLKKQGELVHSETSLLEVDLLRAGGHSLAVPREAINGLGPADRLTCLHRGSTGRDYDVWRVTLRNRLPVVQVPLADGMEDTALDLQEVFDRCYDSGRYDLEIDYSAEPVPPLPAEDAAWADALLREKGLRGASAA